MAEVKKAQGDRDNWKKIQERTFTNWFNDRLRGHLKVGKKQVQEVQLSRHGKVSINNFMDGNSF